MARKEQKLIFTASKTTDGMLKLNMSFYPPLAKTKEAFEALPMDRREMQNALADIGRYALERMAQRERKTDEQKVKELMEGIAQDGEVQSEGKSDEGAGETDGDLRQQSSGS